MGTRATICFKEGEDEYFVYRGHDGFPGNVQEDIDDVLADIKGRWSDPELSLLVTCFLGLMYDQKLRVPIYEITSGFHGDESYKYYVEWSEPKKDWNVRIE